MPGIRTSRPEWHCADEYRRRGQHGGICTRASPAVLGRLEIFVSDADDQRRDSSAISIPVRDLANFLGDSALYEHLRGNDAAALELVHNRGTFRRMRGRRADAHFSPRRDRDRRAGGLPPRPSSHGNQHRRGRQHRIGATPDGTATRGQVKALIAELLDSEPSRLAMQRAYATQRTRTSPTASSGSHRAIGSPTRCMTWKKCT